MILEQEYITDVNMWKLIQSRMDIELENCNQDEITHIVKSIAFNVDALIKFIDKLKDAHIDNEDYKSLIQQTKDVYRSLLIHINVSFDEYHLGMNYNQDINLECNKTSNTSDDDDDRSDSDSIGIEWEGIIDGGYDQIQIDIEAENIECDNIYECRCGKRLFYVLKTYSNLRERKKSDIVDIFNKQLIGYNFINMINDFIHIRKVHIINSNKQGCNQKLFNIYQTKLVIVDLVIINNVDHYNVNIEIKMNVNVMKIYEKKYILE